MTPARATTLHAQYLRWHSQQERIATRLVLARFGIIAARLVGSLGKSSPAAVLGALPLLVSDSDFTAMLTSVYVKVGSAAAEIEYTRLTGKVKRLGVAILTKDKEPPKLNVVQRMTELARSTETGERVAKLARRTREVAGEVLQAAVSGGWSAIKTANKLRRAVVDKARALLIATTETTRAASAGIEAGALATGMTLYKQWIATADTRTRPSHLAMLSVAPIRADGLFNVGGRAMKYPGDPAGGGAETANCRCTLRYVINN